LKKVNKKRTVTVRGVIIFFEDSEGGGDSYGGDSFADPCQEFKQGFVGVSSGLPFV
jgi:hypothetical protein